jgi:hypothetical protein
VPELLHSLVTRGCSRNRSLIFVRYRWLLPVVPGESVMGRIIRNLKIYMCIPIAKFKKIGMCNYHCPKATNKYVNSAAYSNQVLPQCTAKSEPSSNNIRGIRRGSL